MPNIRCIIVNDEPTARDILKFHIDQIKGIEIVALCKNAIEAFDIINKKKIDLVFLDINMPNMSGISLATSLPKTVKVIFTTAYREYAIDGFNLQVVDYLLKPISLDRLMQSIQKYRVENTISNTTNDYLVVRSNRKMIKISYKDIILIESLSDYIKINTTTKMIVSRATISKIEAKLSNKDFVRIHRSFIVSIPFINSYTSNM